MRVGVLGIVKTRCALARAACRRVGFPEGFGSARRVVRQAAPYEKRVAQTVQILDGFGRDALLSGEGDQQPLGPSANGSANMQIRIEGAPAWQNEGSQGTDDGTGFVDLTLQLLDVRFRNARLFRMDIFGERSQNRAEVEQLVLDALQDARQCRPGSDGLAFRPNPSRAGEGVQLVDCPVTFNARIVLLYVLSANQTRAAGIAGLGVDAVDAY